ncbi:MAG: site-specific integrase [Lachnospiraceae bacterium]|nr:site-specific integrase [Lachnospiraceae bacterium]
MEVISENPPSPGCGISLFHGQGRGRDYQGIASMYRYVDSSGNRKTEYSWRLVETDAHPVSKKRDLSLREKEMQIQKDLMDGISTINSTITLNELFERYIRTKKRLRQNVKDNYVMMFGKHIKSNYIGNMSIKSINKIDVLNAYEAMSESGLSNGSIHIMHNNILFPTFQFAVDNDWLRKNPVKDCIKEYPYDPMNKREALSIKEQKIFTEFIGKDKVYAKYYPIVVLILETALRRGEVLGLTWDNVDLDNEIIMVDHQLYYHSVNGKYNIKVGNPKTDFSNRIIPLSPKAHAILKSVKGAEYFNSIGSGIEINGYKNFVFLNSRKSNVIIPRQFGDALTAACVKYNKKEKTLAEKEGREPELLPMVTPHILRHTACTRIAESGMDIKVLQTVMGHKKVDVTMNIYNHDDMNRMKKEFQKMESIKAEYMQV